MKRKRGEKLRHVNFDKNALVMPTRHVLRTLRRIYKNGYSNPSSTYLDGQKAAELVEKARMKVAIALGCDSDEIFFTSGASESNSWALKIARLNVDPLSHHSLKAARYVNDTKEKKIIAFPWIVSETGECLKDKYNLNLEGAHFFIDITQAIGKEKIDLHSMPNVLMASASGQKFGSIQGAGILYIKKEFQENIEPLIYGSQERGLRGGTTNLPAIVCFGEAIEEATKKLEKNVRKTNEIISAIRKGIDKKINKVYYDMQDRRYYYGIGNPLEYGYDSNVINITFNNISAATAVQLFSQYGINISAGSACEAEQETPSQAYLESGYTTEEAMRTIRVSVDSYNTKKEVKKFIKVLMKIVALYDNDD